MTDLMDYREGATPIDPDEMAGLRFKHVSTRGELDQKNIKNIYRTRFKLFFYYFPSPTSLLSSSIPFLIFLSFKTTMTKPTAKVTNPITILILPVSK